MTTKINPRKGEQLLRSIDRMADSIGDPFFVGMYREAIRRVTETGDNNLLLFLSALEHKPVSMDTFLTSKEFMGATDLKIWPEVHKALVEMNQNWWLGINGGGYDEAILKGATGTAKSTISIVDTLYTMHLLMCMKNPQGWYGLSKQTTIVLAILAHKPHVMRRVVYTPMRKYLEAMPWFQTAGLPNKLTMSSMVFDDKNINIVPAGGDEEGVIGDACIHAVIDEINFMNVVMKSKKAEAGTGRPGIYDQAQQAHSTLRRRKKSRFLRPGPTIGKIIASSSTRYKGDFTDKREDEVRKDKSIKCYVYNRRQYDVLPAERFSGKKFRLLIANEVQHATRVLEDDEEIDIEGVWIEEVPIEYRSEFGDNIHDALRDILGISSNVISPFIKSRHKVYESVALGREMELESFLEKDNVVLGVDGMLRVKNGHYCTSPGRPRFLHIDLSLTGDRCGIAMVRFDGMRKIPRPGGTFDLLPVGVVEMAASIAPDSNNEIIIAEVRGFAQSLKSQHGYPIVGVSYDGFQSRESIQEWRKSGIRAKEISMDRSSTPHKQTRDAIYDGRLILLDNEEMITEYVDLEYDASKDKIDHTTTGSKDIADAVTGAFTNMLESRRVWQNQRLDDSDEEGRAPDSDRYEGPRR